jgi:hypothetical protein
MKIPKKHLGKHPRIMKREVKKHSGKEDSDASAYKDWDADYKSGKAGKGEKIPTKVSKYTKKYKEMFGESEEFQDQKNIINFDNFQELAKQLTETDEILPDFNAIRPELEGLSKELDNTIKGEPI